MDNDANFILYYSADLAKYDDKPRFRSRMLKYLEDIVNSHSPQDVNKNSRSELGLDILSSTKVDNRSRSYQRYEVEKTFHNEPIDVILSFITVAYDVIKNSYAHAPDISINFVSYVNKIFREESMRYALNDTGRVRFYPDDEFQKIARSTLLSLSKEKFLVYKNNFEDILDTYLKETNTETPLHKLFACIETLLLTVVSSDNYNRLSSGLIKAFFGKLSEKGISKDYTNDDIENLGIIPEGLEKWVSTVHKYRHGKKGQVGPSVPLEIFDLLFSQGISYLRFCLEVIDKCELI